MSCIQGRIANAAQSSIIMFIEAIALSTKSLRSSSTTTRRIVRRTYLQSRITIMILSRYKRRRHVWFLAASQTLAMMNRASSSSCWKTAIKSTGRCRSWISGRADWLMSSRWCRRVTCRDCMMLICYMEEILKYIKILK